MSLPRRPKHAVVTSPSEAEEDAGQERLSHENVAELCHLPLSSSNGWSGSRVRAAVICDALDIAMGRGRHALPLARAGFRTFGVDVQLDAVRDAIDAGRREGLRISGWCADLTRPSLPRDRFDLVVVTPISAARSVCRSGGVAGAGRHRDLRNVHDGPAGARPPADLARSSARAGRAAATLRRIRGAVLRRGAGPACPMQSRGSWRDRAADRSPRTATKRCPETRHHGTRRRRRDSRNRRIRRGRADRRWTGSGVASLRRVWSDRPRSHRGRRHAKSAIHSSRRRTPGCASDAMPPAP